MYVILLALGLVGAVAGAGLIVLNPPIDAVRLAHTLLILGTVALTGGAILLGMAAVNRHLRRIAQLLDTKPQPRAAVDMEASEAPLVLSPMVKAPSSPFAEPSVSPSESAAHDLHVEPDMAVHPVVLDPAIEEVPPPAPVPPPATPKPDNSAFDAMWASASRAAHGEPDPSTHEPDAHETAPTQDGEAASVFKSGVIDGMAYTLYTDGSIEAEMPGGTVRFASVDELRAYLDEGV